MQQGDLSHVLADLNEALRLDPTAPTINLALNQVQQTTE
ncbi:tetratricopeptide repeat protein [Thermogemmatispora tikiterensis]|nr:tetratricopeptide repeat protein [Thermogemmatispora tikiterensis]